MKVVLEMSQKINFRVRKLIITDIDNCISLFQATVHSINANDYSIEQLHAWAPLVEPMKIDNYSYWQTLIKNIAYVAEYNNQIIGFSDLNNEGYLDRLFVHKDFQKQGIATALVMQLENEARNYGIKQLTVQASVTAKPFFIKMGFYLVKKSFLEIRGMKLRNYWLAKNI